MKTQDLLLKKTIMVAKEYDGSLTGYHTTIDNILNTIKGNYEKELSKEENANA